MITLYANGQEFLSDNKDSWVLNTCVADGYFVAGASDLGLSKKYFAVKQKHGNNVVIGIKSSGYGELFLRGTDTAIPDFAQALKSLNVQPTRVMAEEEQFNAYVSACGLSVKKSVRNLCYMLEPNMGAGEDISGVEPATRKYLPAMQKLLGQYRNRSGLPAVVGDMHEALATHLDEYALCVRGGRVVSLCRLERKTEKSARITAVITLEGCEGKGYASRVISYFAQTQGVKCYALIPEDMESVRSLFAHLGFAQTRAYVRGILG